MARVVTSFIFIALLVLLQFHSHSHSALLEEHGDNEDQINISPITSTTVVPRQQSSRKLFSGYLAPEYARHGQLTKKADIYSFGILALKIISGGANLDSFRRSDEQDLLEMILFFLIVVDRIIYLWSFGWGKVIYYFFSLVLFTYSVTLYARNMEAKGQFKGELALRAFYLTKAISLTLEALQIKFGLPHKSALYGQFLTRRINNANFLGFRIYRALPFLYKLRCVLDWSCTATALTMYDWLKEARGGHAIITIYGISSTLRNSNGMTLQEKLP